MSGGTFHPISSSNRLGANMAIADVVTLARNKKIAKIELSFDENVAYSV